MKKTTVGGGGTLLYARRGGVTFSQKYFDIFVALTYIDVRCKLQLNPDLWSLLVLQYDLQKRFMGNDFNGKLILTGSVIGLLLAYLVKFFALSFNNLDSGLAQVTTSMEDAARTLGLNKYKVLRKVHVPLLKVSILTALIMVFLEVIQELPATLILRPFNFETLATVTYMYASDERMIQAAAPSLAIVLISLVPLVAINNIISKSRERKV